MMILNHAQKKMANAHVHNQASFITVLKEAAQIQLLTQLGYIDKVRLTLMDQPPVAMQEWEEILLVEQ
jgi:hypothetical protein